ncbi:MAG: BatA domain-containing protein [Planctomycetia bacterium]
MQFLIPWMLAGTLAAGVPLALHFLRKSKPVVVPWAAMAFLRRSLRETSRKIRFRDLLLLICRMALFILLAIAIARPTLSSLPLSGATDAVLVMDISQSMATQEAGVSRLEQATDAAKALLEKLPLGSSARLLTVSDRVEEKAFGQSGKFDTVRTALESLQPTDYAGDYYPGFEAAMESLRNSPLPVKQVIFFSDMQASGWQRQNASLRSLLEKLPESISVQMVKVGTPVPINIQVLDLEPATGITFSGQRLPWLVHVRNTGDQPASDFEVRLSLTDDPEGGESVRVARLEGGEERVIPIDLLVPRPGRFAVEAKAGSDRFARDNQKAKIITARDRLRVLVVEGKSLVDPFRTNGFFLAHALRSSTGDANAPRLEVKTISAAMAGPEHLEESDVIFLVDPVLAGSEQLRTDFAEQLPNWMKTGHGLIYFAGKNVLAGNPEELHPIYTLIDGVPQPWKADANKAFHLDTQSVSTEWLGRFQPAPLNQISQADFSSIYNWPSNNSSSKGSQIVSFSNGTPAMWIQKFSNGILLKAGWTPDLECTDLPLRPTFVPLVQTILARILEQSEPRRIFPVELPLAIQSNSRETLGKEQFVWIAPDGHKYPSKHHYEGDRRIFEAEFQPERSGVWKLQSPGSDEDFSTQVALQSSPMEGLELGGLQGPEIDEILGRKVYHHQAGITPSESWSSQGELSWMVMVLVGLLFLFETFFAWWAGKPL